MRFITLCMALLAALNLPAVPQTKEAAGADAKQVTVTLVRWPYT